MKTSQVIATVCFNSGDINYAIAHCGRYALAHCGRYAIAHCGRYDIAHCGRYAIAHCGRYAIAHCGRYAIAHCGRHAHCGRYAIAHCGRHAHCGRCIEKFSFVLTGRPHIILKYNACNYFSPDNELNILSKIFSTAVS